MAEACWLPHLWRAPTNKAATRTPSAGTRPNVGHLVLRLSSAGHVQVRQPRRGKFMKRSLFAAIAAIGLVGGLGAATSANALVFAVFNPVSGSSGGVSNFSEDGMGHLTSTPATSAPTVFTFELSPLAAFGDLQSTFDFSASNATGATTGSIGGVSYVSAPYTG